VEEDPVNAGYIAVPTYDPYIVYAPPGPGFFVGGAIGFGTGFAIGANFGTWGWGGGFDWRAHNVFVQNAVWGRTWSNRGVYVHNYGNWNGGRWRQTVVNRNGSRYVNMQRNANSNRNIGGNGNVPNNPSAQRNVYNGNQRFAVTPSRGYEQHPQPERSSAFHGTENGRNDHAAAAWGHASRDSGNAGAGTRPSVNRGGGENRNAGGNRGNEGHDRGGHR
jgi:hypothetical protein